MDINLLSAILFNDKCSALEALGRRLESCRPDLLKQSHIIDLPRLAFLMEIEILLK